MTHPRQIHRILRLFRSFLLDGDSNGTDNSRAKGGTLPLAGAGSNLVTLEGPAGVIGAYGTKGFQALSHPPNLRLASMMMIASCQFGNEVCELIFAEPPFFICRSGKSSDGALEHDSRRHLPDVGVQRDG